jgi:hypothetical protein
LTSLRNDRTYSDIVKAFSFEVLMLNQFLTYGGSPSVAKLILLSLVIMSALLLTAAEKPSEVAVEVF